ncbi:MAG TPA: hypothetical protein VLD65_09040 [Anaerolineales bacterium]|nr:hypothetical protein [Anaerolineales bacterium]
MKSKRFILILMLLIITSLACFSTGAKTPESDIVFSDDFSDTSKKWDQVTETSRTTGYYNETYRITVNDINSDAWANPGKESFTDTRIEVDASKNGGPDDNDFGVICRYIDTTKFYYGVVSSDGYYAIMKMTADGGSPLGNEKMAESDVINKGTASNHIRFDCVGSTLTLYVNGTQIDQQTDTEYSFGNGGLLAGTFSTAGADILFDNFIVYKP